jgi:hypothetical protein
MGAGGAALLGRLHCRHLLHLVSFRCCLPSDDKTVLISRSLKNGNNGSLCSICWVGVLFYSYWRMMQISMRSQRKMSQQQNITPVDLGMGVLCGIVLIGLYPLPLP